MTAATARNLKPFTKGDPRAVEAGRKGAQAREARRAIARGDAYAVAEHLTTLRTTHSREHLGEHASAVAQDILGRLARGEIPVRHAADAAEVLRVLVDIARLEAGLATSHAVTLHATADTVATRVIELQREARALLSSAASTADDDPPAPAADPDA